ncbi:MAG: hypothetical protein GX059_07945 [Clostridiales bacterium]|nr:hypothetical protein [Clostridiales bacterium]
MKDTLRTMLYSLHVIFHPFECFWEVKHRRKNTFAAANLLLVLYCLLITISNQTSGFLFNYVNPEERNVLMDVVSIVLPLIMWSVLNWALSTLLDGKGTMKEIWIATIYGMTPMIISVIPGIIISRFLTLDESMFYSVFMNGMFYWSLILILLGNMVIHEYTLKKTILIALFTLIGFVAVVLIFIIFLSTFQQLIIFINTIYAEFKYRL